MRKISLTVVCVVSTLFALTGCGGSGGSSGSSAKSDPKTETKKIGDGKIDLNGRWVGYGTDSPGNLWSVNYDHKSRSPIAAGVQTKCKVTIQFVQKSDYLRIATATISYPEVPGLGYFNAQLVDWYKSPNAREASVFNRTEFKVEEDPAGSSEFSLKPILRNGTVGFGSSADRLSFKTQTLKLHTSGPYTGAYRDGSSQSYTSSRDFDFSWATGSLVLNSIKFWAYGASVSHATDASCTNVQLVRETMEASLPSEPPPPPPPLPVEKPRPVANVPVKTIRCTIRSTLFNHDFTYVVPKEVFDIAAQIEPSASDYANTKNIPISSYLYAVGHEVSNSRQGGSRFGQFILEPGRSVVMKVYRWKRDDNLAFRFVLDEKDLRMTLYTPNDFSTISVGNQTTTGFFTGSLYSYGGTGPNSDPTSCTIN